MAPPGGAVRLANAGDGAQARRGRKLDGMPSLVAAGRSTARDRYDAACHRQSNTQVPVSSIFDRASTQGDHIELANLWQAAVEGA
jgi:hypothetical protein